MFPIIFAGSIAPGLTLCQLLPVYPEQRTSSGRSGMSEKCHKATFAAYSITSRPSACAVFALMTKSNLVGATPEVRRASLPWLFNFKLSNEG